MADQVSASGLDTKHNPSIPSIRLLLGYEAALELSSRLDLEETCRRVRGG